MRIKFICLVVTLLISLTALGQNESPAKEFWNTLQSHCGKAYEGVL